MKVAIADIETDALDATRIHCVVVKDYQTKEVFRFVGTREIDELPATLVEYDRIVMHNGINFDAPVLNRLVVYNCLPLEKVLDTLVVTRLGNYSKEGGHSLNKWGERLKFPKGEFTDFSEFTQEMLDYCVQDVLVTEKLYERFLPMIESENWQQAIETEHTIAIICQEMHGNGFKFDLPKASNMLADVKSELQSLESRFERAFPPVLRQANVIKHRSKSDGTLYKNVQRAIDTYPRTEVVGEELVCYDYHQPAISSPRDRVDCLWQAGWKPVIKTKGHNKFISDRVKDDERKKKFDTYGWTCDEVNLATLPADAPDGAKALAQWLTLEGRRSSLEEWIGHFNLETGRIHGSFNGIGSWTHRLSHNRPNEANIPAAYHGPAETEVDKIKDKYDGACRSLWHVPEGSYLVGTDAEGIQLRILAHLMKSELYRDAILSGDKANETDIHNVNKRALSMTHITRDMAKTFIYAFLLGAGFQKVASVLKCTVKEAKQCVEHFIHSIDGLAELREVTVPRIATAGYFYGLDGRKVFVPSQHKTLAGMLQNGEAVIMKHATINWRERARQERLKFKLLTWPHDEWQTESIGSYEDAEQLAFLQRESIVATGKKLSVFCPLDAASAIGSDWSMTH